MNKNIDLGTFSWDLSKIEKEMIENRRQTEAYSAALALNKKALNEEKKEIQELGTKVAALKEIQKIANDQLKEGKITQAEYNKTISDSNKVIQESETRIREVASAQSAHIKTILEQERAVKELRLENNELNKLYSAGRTEIEGNEHAYRNLNKELNALKTEAKNLGAELVILRREGKENTDEYRALEAQWKATSKQADELNDDFKDIDKAVGDNQRTVGDYTDSIKKAFSDIPDMIMSGDMKGALSSLKGGLGEIFNFVKANPLLLVFSGIALLIKDIWEYNEQIRDMNREVEQLTNSSGDLTDEIRIKAQAIVDTYGGEFKDRVIEIDSLMKDFKVSADEAFQIYNEGLAKGGAANSEFAESIREYGPLFAQNGYSAKEFLAILNSGIDLQIYSDKLPDAIKEAGLALTEQTKATRDALVNAFGAAFADDILAKVRSGEMSVADALEKISQKAEDAHLNQQQLAQLTADVFKGAGEDAGGALKIFEAINHSQDVMLSQMTDLERATYELGQVNEELGEAKDKAYSSDAVRLFQQDVQHYWKVIQTVWYNVLDDITGFLSQAIDGMRLGFMNVRDSINFIPKAFRIIMTGLKSDFGQIYDIAIALAAVIRNAFSFDLTGTSSALDALKNKILNFHSQTKEALGEVGGAFGTSGSINQKNVNKINTQNQVKIQKQAEEDAKKQTGNNKVTGASKDAADVAAKEAKAAADARVRELEKEKKEKEKALEEAAKKALQIAKDEAESRVAIAKNELAEYIAVNSEKIKDENRLTQEKLNAQKKYYDELQVLRQKELDQEKAKALLTADSEQEKLNIEKDFAIKSVELTNEINAQKKELQTQYDSEVLEQKKLAQAIEFQQRILDLEANAASEFDIQRELEDQRFQDQIAKWAEENEIKMQLDDDQYLTEQEIQATRDELQNEYKFAKDENEKLRVQNQLNALDLMVAQSAENQRKIEEMKEKAKLAAISDTLGQAAGLFKEHTFAYKALAIAQAAINTYLGVSKVLAEYAGPVGWAMAAVQIAVGLANVAKIASVKPEGQKAARGMVIRGASHADGGVPVSTPNGMIEAEGGEPILTKKAFQMFPDLISDINVAGGGVPLYASGGVVPSRSASVQSSFRINAGNTVLSEDSVVAIAAAIYSGSQAGIGDMAEDRKIANGANF